MQQYQHEDQGHWQSVTAEEDSRFPSNCAIWREKSHTSWGINGCSFLAEGCHVATWIWRVTPPTFKSAWKCVFFFFLFACFIVRNFLIFKVSSKLLKRKSQKVIKEKKIPVYQHCASQTKHINTSVGQTWQICNSCLPTTATDVVFRTEAHLAEVWSQRGTAGLRRPCKGWARSRCQDISGWAKGSISLGVWWQAVARGDPSCQQQWGLTTP